MLVDRFCIGLSFGNFGLFTIFFTLEAHQLTTVHLDKFNLSSKSSLVAHMPVSALDFSQVSLIFIKYFNFGLHISTRLFKSVQLVKLTFPSSNYTDLTYSLFLFKPFWSRVCPSIRHRLQSDWLFLVKPTTSTLIAITLPSLIKSSLVQALWIWICPSIRHNRLFSLICCFWSKQQPSHS